MNGVHRMDGILRDIALLENILDGRSPPTELSLLVLKHITDDFSEKQEIGRGGFGVVYKVNFYFAFISRSSLITLEPNLIRSN